MRRVPPKGKGQAEYLVIEKDFADNRPRTRVRLTKQGRAACRLYLEFLREIVADYREG